jgi:hypothetical protein
MARSPKSRAKREIPMATNSHRRNSTGPGRFHEANVERKDIIYLVGVPRYARDLGI